MNEYKNAIERTMERKTMVEFLGKDEAEKTTQRLLAAHPLDDRKDAPIPEWALNIMKDKTIGYRTRIKIVMMHHWDITGENPSWRFVQPSDMKNTPPRKAPEWLEKHRDKQTKIADEYIEKQRKGAD